MISTGCGAAGPSAPPTGAHSPTGFAWLHPAPAPAVWRRIRAANGAVLRVPPSWRRAAGDRGTATAVLRDRREALVGYLNLTPGQREETIGTWAAFRTRHNLLEGERRVTGLGAISAAPFAGGRASCVRDAYTTSSGSRFVELACLIRGPSRASVLVGATPPRAWKRIAPVIEQAVSALGA